MDKANALRVLGDYKSKLTRQQVLTIRGQILAGYADDAMRGLAKIVMRGGITSAK